MKPLICPQCGGKITTYSSGQTFTTCSYCSTRFLIDANKEEPFPEPVREPFDFGNALSTIIGVSVAGVLFIVIVIAFLASSPGKTSNRSPDPVYRGATPRSAEPRVSPTQAPDPNLLSFGGKGTGDGLFQGANSIAVDKMGNIFVSDDTMRVQQFDGEGKFLKVWQIPSKTPNYKGARTIDKIAIGENGDLYVAAGGAILIYDPKSTEHKNIVHAAPDYTRDFAIRSDGTLLLMVDKEDTDELIFVNKNLKAMKRIDSFVTDASDAAMSPRQTGLSAIRIAVDGPGNIYAIYAFGDLGSYQISYNAEELLIFRFTSDGKFTNKFVQTMESCGIATDNQGRVYISNRDSINAYTNMGEAAGSIFDLKSIQAFTLDKENNVYAVLDDQVVKRPSLQ